MKIPAEYLDSMDDPEIIRMYVDFCPLVDGCFIAPADFNQIGQSWYLNHSSQPNVVCKADMTFQTYSAIGYGEELTTDYRTFSDHADQFIGKKGTWSPRTRIWGGVSR